MIRSEDVSRRLISSSPTSTMRDSITGTTTIAVALCSSRLSSVVSGSNRRRTTSVEPSPTPTIACMNPRAWNIGTHSSVTSRARNGTLLSRPPISDNERGSERGAPFGVPVVPLVRIVIFGHSAGLGGSVVSPPSISASSVSSQGSRLQGGEPAALVDHHGPVAVAQRARHDRATEQPVALKAPQQLGHPVRRLGTDQPTADAQRREIGLVTGAFGQFGGAPHEPLGI